MLANACDREQPLDLLGATRERELLAVLARALMCCQDHAQTRGIDELEILEVEHHNSARLDLGVLDLLLQKRRAEQIKFAMEREHNPVGLTPDIYSKMLAGGRHYRQS